MTSLEPWQLAVLAGVGAVAGFVNTVAGAGSLLSLRALMLFGLPAGVANGTNRLPVLSQSLTAGLQFYRAGKLDGASVARAAWPASLGALVGSLTATYVPERPMRLLLILVLLAVGLLGLRKSKVKQHDAPVSAAHLNTPRMVLWLFLTGVYGGFLQAGVGLVLIHALTGPGKLDLVRANALKAIVIAIFSVVAATVFVARGQVAWLVSLPMIVGSIVGARIAVAVAISWADRLKIGVVVVDLLACVVLLWQW
ncbi:MAG: sulfite exporter TauE/SafE family protein [Polyangiaceae bacterium]